MLFLHLVSFLPLLVDRVSLLIRRKAAPGAQQRHVPLQGLLVRLR